MGTDLGLGHTYLWCRCQGRVRTDLALWGKYVQYRRPEEGTDMASTHDTLNNIRFNSRSLTNEETIATRRTLTNISTHTQASLV